MKIAILCGGISYEHEISIVSAIALKDVLKVEVTYIFLDKDREFYLIDSDKITSKLISSGEYKKLPKLFLKNNGFHQKALFSEKLVEFDSLLNLIHGGDGEDGKIASLCEFYNIKVISPRTEASVISFNKYLTKIFAKEIGIKVVDYQLINSKNREIKFDFPIILKPVRLGSSIGISIVKEQSELEYALDIAFEFDNQVLVEPFINGVKEYNLAGCKAGEFILSTIEEPQKEEFLDFDKKYLDFARTEKVHKANISKELENKLKDNFKKIYDPLFLGSLIRCDFFIIDNEVYLNEINPIPGSMANYLFNDFNSTIIKLIQYLPQTKRISIDYQYIHSIQSAKGK